MCQLGFRAGEFCAKPYRCSYADGIRAACQQNDQTEVLPGQITNVLLDECAANYSLMSSGTV